MRRGHFKSTSSKNSKKQHCIAIQKTTVVYRIYGELLSGGHQSGHSNRNCSKQPHYTFQSCMLRRRNSGAYGKRTKGNTATVTNVAYEDSGGSDNNSFWG